MTADFFSREHALEDARVRLEPLEEHHFEKLLPVALQLDIWKFMSVKVENEQDFRIYFDQALKEKKDHVAYPFAVYDKQNQRYAGSTRYGAIDFSNKKLEIGWTWYHPDLHGTGLNKHCKILLLSYAFETLMLNRVELKTSTTNQRSQAAMLKIGAVKEGIFRRHIINWNGTLRDSVYFSFIKEEWEETKNKYFKEFLELPA